MKQFKLDLQQKRPVFPNNNADAVTQGGSPAARALLECVSESIFYGAISFPRPTLEASDVIQNKEFFIIYTKVVHFKKIKIHQLC